MNFLNALERIPRYMEQYKVANEKSEQDIPVLQEVVGGVWKKEEELKSLKSDLAALERKIQISLSPQKEEQQATEKSQSNEPFHSTTLTATDYTSRQVIIPSTQLREMKS